MSAYHIHPIIEVSPDSLVKAVVHTVYGKPINQLVQYFEEIGRNNDRIQDTQTNSFKTGKFTFESEHRPMKNSIWPVLDKTLQSQCQERTDMLKDLNKSVAALSRMVAFILAHKQGMALLEYLPSNIADIIRPSCTNVMDIPESEVERFKWYYAQEIEVTFDALLLNSIT